MSRPPIRRSPGSPRGVGNNMAGSRYFGAGFADLVALAESLANDPEGVPEPGGSRVVAEGIVEIAGKDRGLARALVEIPALFAHILGEHQSHYAAEAFIATAQRSESLLAHSRRLGYVPDQGVAATGLAAFTVKAGLSGEVPRHFALQSEPRGEVKSQTYETLEALHVDAEWNAIRPSAAFLPTPVAFVDDQITLPLNGRHPLSPGDVVLLEGGGKRAVCEVADTALPGAITLRRLSQDADSIGAWPTYSASVPYRILARPEVTVRAFGWNADPLAFPPEKMRVPDLYSAPAAVGGPDYGYTVAGLSTGSYTPGQSLLLADVVDAPAAGDLLAVVRTASAHSYALAEAREASVSFRAGERIAVPQPDPPPAGFPVDQLIERAVSGRITLLDLLLSNGAAATWTALPLDAVIHAAWSETIAIAATVPNTTPLSSTVLIDADLSGMRPGRKILLERPSNGAVASAIVTRLSPPLISGAPWEVVLGMEGGAVASAFPMHDVLFRANTVAVSHGETRTETVAGSDGITPHQQFELKKAPVTRIPGAGGAEIELEIRVDGVLWDLVEDFHDTEPQSRVVQVLADAAQSTRIAFGGEGRGAVPPSGQRNITAEYRVGLGRTGDTDPGRLTRIRKSSPILEAVTNPMPLSGGTDPASIDDMRRQATRPILTFDRAVSVQDHADLALLFPGVARTAARWLNRGAVELIAADAVGEPPAEPAALRAFLDARRDDQVPLVLLAPQAVDVVLELRVERNSAWLADAVRLAVTEALIGEDAVSPGLFTFAGREFSQPQALSGLYRRILDTAGASGVEAKRFALMPSTGSADILHATDRQWLRLLPGNLEIEIAEPGALIPAVEEVGA